MKHKEGFFFFNLEFVLRMIKLSSHEVAVSEYLWSLVAMGGL